MLFPATFPNSLYTHFVTIWSEAVTAVEQKPKGRWLKYQDLLTQLEDDAVFTAPTGFNTRVLYLSHSMPISPA